MESLNTPIKATTVIAVRHKGELAIGADGQATRGDAVVKSTVKKLRRLGEGNILAGFAGSTADAFTLLERFESQLSAHVGNMYHAALKLAKDWRTDRYLRKLEAIMIVADSQQLLTISGTGDVMRPDYDIAAIGSGGMYAHAAAIALKRHKSQLSAKAIVEESLKIAADICIYTNHNLIIETLPSAT